MTFLFGAFQGQLHKCHSISHIHLITGAWRTHFSSSLEAGARLAMLPVTIGLLFQLLLPFLVILLTNAAQATSHVRLARGLGIQYGPSPISDHKSLQNGSYTIPTTDPTDLDQSFSAKGPFPIYRITGYFLPGEMLLEGRTENLAGSRSATHNQVSERIAYLRFKITSNCFVFFSYAII